jgi:potassium/hydrogen antiporter
LQQLGAGVAVVCGTALVALMFRGIADRVRVPAPAIFLLAAAIASDLYAPLGAALSPKDVTWIASLALVVILFDGGVALGWSSVRPVVWPVITLGFGATLVTAATLAVACHALLDITWSSAAILAVALSPTDPAVVFSVIGEGRLPSRVKTILEAEAGANDPIAIALMVGVLATLHGHGEWLPVVTTTFVRELAIGLLIGVGGAWLMRRPLTNLTRPRETLQPIVALSAAGLIFGVASALDGSGFIAVFVAGLLLGDADPVGQDVRAFHSELAGLAEVVVFVSLGLTVHLAALGRTEIVGGLVLTVVLLAAARPPAAVALLAAFELPEAERRFVAWAGMRGAVPILLAALALADHVDDARLIYGSVFVIVTASVLIQGVTLSHVAARLQLNARDEVRDGPRSPT